MNKYERLLAITIFIIVGLMFFSMANLGSTHSNISKTVDAKPFSIGTSTISLGSSSISVKAGSSGSDSYTVRLSSGSSWGTSLTTSSVSGFTVSLSNSYGDPTYTGTATISVSSSVSNGTYKLNFQASGDDPSSSPAVLTVTVTGHSSSATPPPVKTTPTKSFADLYGSDIAGASVIILFLLAAAVPVALGKRNLRALGYVSFILSMGSAIFLIADDSLLRTSAYLHWVLLLAFTAGMIISMLGYLLMKGKLKDTARKGLAYGSIFMSIAMILDAALGLPLSSISNVGSSLGFNYLFGFGISSPSTVAVSVAFSILLIVNGLMFGAFFKPESVEKKAAISR